MDGEFQVRPARLADAEGIYALIREHTTELVPRSLGNVVENIDRFLVAEGPDGALAGCIAYQVWPEIGDPLKATVELQSVAVWATCRRKGRDCRSAGRFSLREFLVRWVPSTIPRALSSNTMALACLLFRS